MSLILNGGLIERAQAGKETYEKASEDEEKQIEEADKKIAGISGDQVQKPEEDSGYTGIKPVNIETDQDIGRNIEKLYKPRPAGVAEGATSWSYNAPRYAASLTSNIMSGTARPEAFDWEIWGKDTNNLYLISTIVLKSAFDFYSMESFNNAVYYIDDMCNKLYSNEKLGATARNLKIEDVQNVTKYEYDKEINSGIQYGEIREYSRILSGAYIDVGTDIQMKNKSKQAAPIPSVKLCQTYWRYGFYASKAEEEWKNKKYYDLICGIKDENKNSRSYWLSSKSIKLESTDAKFGIFAVQSNTIEGVSVASGLSKTATTNNIEWYRPIVQIPLTSCEFDQNGSLVGFKY